MKTNLNATSIDGQRLNPARNLGGSSADHLAKQGKKGGGMSTKGNKSKRTSGPKGQQ